MRSTRSSAALPVKFDFLARAKDELDGRLTWVLDFSADLFEAATARRLTRRFETFVADLVSRPDATLSALSLVTDAERRRPAVSDGRPAGPSIRSRSVSTRRGSSVSSIPGAA